MSPSRDVPSASRWMIERLLERGLAHDALGDLQERFETIAERDGLASAKRWYRRQALLLCLSPSLLRHPTQRALLSAANGTLSDLRVALRGARREPASTTAIVLSLAVSICAATAVFSALDRYLVRLPDGLFEPERLVEIYRVPLETDRDRTLGYDGYRVLSLPLTRKVAEDSQTLSDVSPFLPGFWLSVLVEGDEPERMKGAFVSANHFEVLGVRPLLGRAFSPDPLDEVEEPVVILSHALWQRRFGGRYDVLGRTLRAGGKELTVVGVAPRGFVGTSVVRDPDFWAPLSMVAVVPYWGERASRPTVNMWSLAARLDDGVTLADAAADLDRIGREHYEDPSTLRPVPLLEATVDPNRREGFLKAGATLFAAVTVVLLVACLNVTNILLARNAGRRRELAVRSALGASRGRLVRQLFTESSLPFLTGAAAGVALLLGVRPWLARVQPPERFYFSDPTLELPFDLRVLSFALVLTGLSVAVFGVLPALRAVSDPRRASHPGGSPLRRLLPAREALVVLQVAFSLVALAGAGVFARALGAASRLDSGFRAAGVGMVSMDLDYGGLLPEEQRAFYSRATDDVRALPGVEGAAVNWLRPLEFGPTSTLYRYLGAPSEDRVQARLMIVTPGYFETMGIPLLAGRDFHPTDAGARGVVVINQAAAELLWPGESEMDVVGRELQMSGAPGLAEILGVVPTGRYVSLGERPGPALYALIDQSTPRPTGTLFFRTAGPPEDLLPSVEERLRAIDARVVVYDAEPAQALLGRALWTARAAAALLTGLGAVALLLAALGVYGLATVVVGERRREIGIRIALGAGSRRVFAGVVGRLLLLAGAGTALGLGVVFAGGRVAEGLLYGVPPTDRLALVVACGALLATALVSAALPARSATRVDPLEVIRSV